MSVVAVAVASYLVSGKLELSSKTFSGQFTALVSSSDMYYA